jgi:hypothetical protein
VFSAHPRRKRTPRAAPYEFTKPKQSENRPNRTVYWNGETAWIQELAQEQTEGGGTHHDGNRLAGSDNLGDDVGGDLEKDIGDGEHGQEDVVIVSCHLQVLFQTGETSISYS